MSLRVEYLEGVSLNSDTAVMHYIGMGHALCVSATDAFCQIDHGQHEGKRCAVPLHIAQRVVERYATGGENPPERLVLRKVTRNDVGNKPGYLSQMLPGDTHSCYRFIQ